MPKKETDSKDVRSLYTEDYFLESATGHSEFLDFKGKYEDLIEKFQFIIRNLNLTPDVSLLDIGCGRGEVVIYHSLNGGAATGVDYSEDAVKIAQAKAIELGAKCRFIEDSFENINEETKFDRIISVDFIEHISREESKNYFRKCFNILNPGGRMIVYTYPNTIRRRYGYKLIRIFALLKNRHLPEKEPDTVSTHYKQYHLNEQNYYSLKELAKSAGFIKVRVIYYDPSVKDSLVKKVLVNTPLRHLFLKGLTLIADK